MLDTVDWMIMMRRKGSEPADSMMIGVVKKMESEPTHRERMRKESNRMERQLDDHGQVDVIEMFSPPRITAEAQKWGFRTGEAMDLQTGWDFNLERDRTRAWEYILEHEPLLIVGSPCCTMFSQMQNLNQKHWLDKERRPREGVRHLRFLGEVYQFQIDRGRVFLHEHPAGALSLIHI